MSDIAENEFVTREQIQQLKQTIEAQRLQLEEEGHLGESDEFYTSFGWEEGGFVELSCGTDGGFIQIAPEGLSDGDFSTVEDEVKRAIGGSTSASLEFVHRGSTVVRYDVEYDGLD